MMKQRYILEMRLSYAFNDSNVSGNPKGVLRVLIVKKITYVREKRGRFKGELYRAQFFRNSCRTREDVHCQNGHNSEN